MYQRAIQSEKDLPRLLCAGGQQCQAGRREIKMLNKEKLKQEIAELLSTQKLAVLSTQSGGGFAYASLIAFAASEDLRTIVLATPRATRKFANITNNPNIALLIDNRSNMEKDFHDAKAVTVMGVAQEQAADGPGKKLAALYLEKHPYLDAFLRAPTTAFISIAVQRYYLVSRFQEVMELHIQNENDLSVK